MCVIVCRYIPDLESWCIAKNRDRNYKPTIRIRKSFRNDIERLYIWDETTKYTEGVNEYGVGIISASVTVKEDESEGSRVKKINKTDIEERDRIYYSPDGLRIRKALFENSALNAINSLIELEISGNTIVADKERCFLLEGAFVDDKYLYKPVEVPQDKFAIRTNHGIMLPWTGYSVDVPGQEEKRHSSEMRYNKVAEALRNTNTIEGVLDALSVMDENEPQLNPLRVDTDRGAMRTTGQILIVPGERILHYRSVWGETIFDMENLNTSEGKTFFELVSTRKLISFRQKIKENE